MFDVNLTTGKTGRLAKKPLEVDSIDFWRQYVRLLNSMKNTDLTYIEQEVMAYVLNGEVSKSYFRGKLASELRSKFRLNKSRLSLIKSKLVLKGFLQDTGVTRGDCLPSTNILAFQKFINSNNIDEVCFHYCFKIM
jgi:hypothetical protein